MLRGDLKAMVALDALLCCMLYVICARGDLEGSPPQAVLGEWPLRYYQPIYSLCHDDGKLTPVGWALCPLLSVNSYTKSQKELEKGEVPVRVDQHISGKLKSPTKMTVSKVVER